MHVDEAGGDVRAAGVEHPRAGGVDGRSHLGDAPVDHEHVGRVGRAAGAVEDRATPEDDSTHRSAPSFWRSDREPLGAGSHGAPSCPIGRP